MIMNNDDDELNHTEVLIKLMRKRADQECLFKKYLFMG